MIETPKQNGISITGLGMSQIMAWLIPIAFLLALSGLIMMHAPVLKNGKWKALVKPYIITLIPAMVGIFGFAILIEIIFHFRHSPVGENDMTYFGFTFSDHNPVVWLTCLGGIAICYWITRRNTPALIAAWDVAHAQEGNES